MLLCPIEPVATAPGSEFAEPPNTVTTRANKRGGLRSQTIAARHFVGCLLTRQPLESRCDCHPLPFGVAKSFLPSPHFYRARK
jgi:hypothetical protein